MTVSPIVGFQPSMRVVWKAGSEKSLNKLIIFALHPRNPIQIMMKTSLSLAIAAATILATFSSPKAEAVKVTLDGTGHYRFTSQVRYYTGVKQSGRYKRLGADYYRKTVIGMRWVTNNSRRASRPLSIELWGMPFYGAESGIVLMTKDAGKLRAFQSYRGRKWQGWSIFLDEYRFPEINIWEAKKRRGWSFRDALSFRRDNLL